jgi:integrase
VFPLLNQKGRRATSRYFSYQLKRKKLKTRAKHLHSLRHTVTVKLIEAETPTTIQNRLLGHALGKSVELRVYGWSSKFAVTRLKEAIEKISFPSRP